MKRRQLRTGLITCVPAEEADQCRRLLRSRDSGDGNSGQNARYERDDEAPQFHGTGLEPATLGQMHHPPDTTKPYRRMKLCD